MKNQERSTLNFANINREIKILNFGFKNRIFDQRKRL